MRGLAMTLMMAVITASGLEPAALSSEELSRVSSLKVFFAHQSVGGNMLEGVSAVAGSTITTLAWSGGGISRGINHFLAGQNEAPLSKLQAFEQAMDQVGGQVDVAMVKLCYVDFNPDTDVGALAERYRQTLDRVQAKFPKVRVVAVTTPLTLVQKGIKGFLKHVMGKPAWGELENPKRRAFNDALRASFPADRLFDLAAAEVRPGEVDLRDDFTDDGGHLNQLGQKAVATAWLRFLAK